MGPDFRKYSHLNHNEAVDILSVAYRNVFNEYHQSKYDTLRLLPISGGIFSGHFKSCITSLTKDALEMGYYASELYL